MVAAKVTMTAGALAVASALVYFAMLLVEPASMAEWVPTNTTSQRALVGVIPLLAGLFLMVLGLPREPMKNVTRLPQSKPLQVQLKPPTANLKVPSTLKLHEGQASNPRDDLLARLDDLNSKVNRAKVQFGLGQLSPQGYEHYVKKLEGERAEIEQRLLDAELQGKPLKPKEN